MAEKEETGGIRLSEVYGIVDLMQVDVKQAIEFLNEGDFKTACTLCWRGDKDKGESIWNMLPSYKGAVGALIDHQCFNYLKKHYGFMSDVLKDADELIEKAKEKYKPTSNRGKEMIQMMSIALHRVQSVMFYISQYLLNAPDAKGNALACNNTTGQEKSPQRANKQPQHVLELETKEAKAILQRAVDFGLCSCNDGVWKWEKTKALLAYFAARASEFLKLGKGTYYSYERDEREKISWQPFEKLFCKNRLVDAYNEFHNKVEKPPRGYDIVDKLFD